MKTRNVILAFLVAVFLFVSGFLLGGYCGFKAGVAYAIAYFQDVLPQREAL